MKKIRFMGSSLKDLRSFPDTERGEAGNQWGGNQWGQTRLISTD